MPSELREALTAAGASALIPKVIDPILLEYQRRYSPLVRAIPMQQWSADQYFFNQRTSVANGGFVPDGGARTVSNSVYLQLSYQMKHVESVGAVTGYAQEVTRQVIGDLRQTEIQGSIRGYYWDVEAGCLWGNSASTLNQAQPQFDGLDTLVNQYTPVNGYQNALDKAGNTLTLAMLDELIDMVETAAAMPVFDDTWMLVMSNTSASKVAQLLTNQQRFNDTVEVAAGLIVPTYRNIPLIKTSFLSARGQGMGTVSGATSTSYGAGTLNGTFKYVVSPVISRQGETLPCAEVSVAVTTGDTIALTFTPPTGLDGLSPILYKVYRTAGAAGSETFLGYVDATVGLMADGVTPVIANTIVDNGTALIPAFNTTIPGTVPTQYFGTNTGMLPSGPGQENIYLISRDRNNVVRPYIREGKPLDVYPTTASPDTLPYAVIGDMCLAVRAQRYLGRLSRVATSV